MAGSITLFYYDMYVWPRQGVERITSLIKINEADFYLFTPAITFLDTKKINNRDYICNITSFSNEIISALDAIITNT